MRAATKSLPPFSATPPKTILALGAVLVLAVAAAYHNGLSGALVYDDRTVVTENDSIAHLWPIGPALSPPIEAGTCGRPVANYTFALSHALSGQATWGYHALNVFFHALSALVLFGVVRRTLLLPALRARFGRDATPLAGATAAVWALHPVATQTVTYISQRTEGLMALFYLLTFYCFIRGTEQRPRLWHSLAVAACWLGAASKEVMMTAPVLVLWYDRTFVAGSFLGAWRSRWRFYCALGACWGMIAILLTGVAHRGVGLGMTISWQDYALTECHAVATYLGLSFWPHPLVFDYGLELLRHVTEALPYALVLAPPAALAVLGLGRWQAAGFLGVWFFVVLAPTSSFVPIIQQPVAINRMYLPMAASVIGLALGLHALLGRRAIAVAATLAVAFGLATWQRNEDFRTEISLWGDTIQKQPGNARAHYNLGVALDYSGRRPEAIVQYEAAVRLQPTYAEAQSNLGNALLETGHATEALPHLELAVRLKADYPDAHYNLGNALRTLNQPEKAIRHYEIAQHLSPDAKNLNNLGVTLYQLGRVPEARSAFERAIKANPKLADAHNNLAAVLSQSGALAEAIAECEEALRLNPQHASARENIVKLRAQAAGK